MVMSNGQLLIGLDDFGQVYDFYFPYVGHENHLSQNTVNKFGVWVEGNFHWLDDPHWQRDIHHAAETMSAEITAYNEYLKLELRISDVVYNEENIYLRRVDVINRSERPRLVKLYFNQQFTIYESARGDTAIYDPHHDVVIHYKGRRVFLANAWHDNRGIHDHSIGQLGIEGKEGTFRDAEDGDLAENHIEHGIVDSVISVEMEIEPNRTETAYHWVAAAKSFSEAYRLNDLVLRKKPDYLIYTTQCYWRSWANKQNYTFHHLSKEVVDLFKSSLLTIRTHINDNGPIMASCDSDLLKHGKGMYTYNWHRDGALVAASLDKAGYSNVTRRFFEFCNRSLEPDGYFLHKYLADESLGSSWHPWVRDGKPSLPIQEDETALVIWALWEHYKYSKDLEFVEHIYNSLIKQATQFLVSYIDYDLYLPYASYDLWEEIYGVTTFTCSAVYAGLLSASKFAHILGKKDKASEYATVAENLRESIIRHLYDETEGYFYKYVTIHNGKIVDINRTVDSASAFGIHKFGVLPVDDPRLESAFKVTKERLTVPNEVGGLCRYENDYYFRITQEYTGNPWIITTLWIAQFEIAKAKTESDLKSVQDTLEWVKKYTVFANMISEQLNPYTGAPLSVNPLIWSHAEYVNTIMDYMEKLEELGIAPKQEILSDTPG